jgi:hypothetical protein
MIGDDIYIIDNVIPKDKQNKLEDLFTGNTLQNWVFNKDIAIHPSEIKRLGITKLTPGIGYHIKQWKPKYTNEHLLRETKIIAESACVGIGKKLDEIFNTRSFIHFPLAPELRKPYDNIHIDLPIEHLVILYYVNDSDGDTFLFDKRANYKDLKTTAVEVNDSLNIIKKISPKKGRALVFNGDRYHSSSGPTKDIRCIINFDVSIK